MLIYDLFEHVIQYLDYKSTINLLKSCKLYYSYYDNNKIYINKILINKIFEYFYIPKIKLAKLPKKENILLLKQLQYIFEHFYMHRTTKYVNMLHFIIENENKFEIGNENKSEIEIENNVNFLYKTLLELCIQKNSEEDNYQAYVTSSDLKYLLIHGNKYQLQLLLKKFYVDSKIVFLVLKDLLSKNNQNFDNRCDYDNIIILIRYFFYKFSFNRNIETTPRMTFNIIDTKFLYTIINLVIQNSRYKKSVFKIIVDLIKKYNIPINHFQLIESCIISDNLDIFKYLITKFDTNNYSIMIRPHYIKLLIKNGNFEFLEYIVENLLGQFINLDLYVKNLYSGILKFYENKFFIKTKIMQIEIFYHKICKYLSESNKQKIQKAILSIFD